MVFLTAVAVMVVMMRFLATIAVIVGRCSVVVVMVFLTAVAVMVVMMRLLATVTVVVGNRFMVVVMVFLTAVAVMVVMMRFLATIVSVLVGHTASPSVVSSIKGRNPRTSVNDSRFYRLILV